MVNGVLQVAISEVLMALLLVISPLVRGRFQSRYELIHGTHTEHLITQGMWRFKSAPVNGNPDTHFDIIIDIDLTAIGLAPGRGITRHIYNQTIPNLNREKNLGSAVRAPSLLSVIP